MTNDSYNSKARYDFKRAMQEINEYRGKGTELVSVYVPEGKQISDVMAYLRDESGQATNIRSKTTMKNVTSAIDSIMARLKTFKTIPPNGIVIFCGEVIRSGDQTKMVQYTIYPPDAITAFMYRCDSTFFTEPLESMLVEKEYYGLITIDRKEATLGMLAGSRINVLKHYDSLVPSKHHQGGQSSVRFERLIEIAAHEFYTKVAEGCTVSFLDSIQDLKGILVGGPGMTKEYFASHGYLHHELQKKVVTPYFDTSYTDEYGLKELVNSAQAVIQDMHITEEKELMQRFFAEIRKEDAGLSAYGEDVVRQCSDMGAVDTFLISPDLKKYRVTAECSKGHVFEKTVEDPDANIECPECGDTAKVKESKDLVDDFFDIAEKFGSKVELISGDSEEGDILMKAFGGIAALLRYNPM